MLDDPRFIISDATPIHYLILIHEIDLLQSLYGRIVIPSGVAEELSEPQTPPVVRDWIRAMPAWAEIAAVSASHPLPFPALGRGEREAIWLASRHPDSILLTDDLPARSAAASIGIQTVPTIRVLTTAAALSLVDLEGAITLLLETNFRVSPKVIGDILRNQPLK